ncbi:MAG: hypothetical protein E7D52_03705 [Peptoniphilus harei]|uniref:hypothetical protein n=1 Tax=Peptoniphilus harei TaxID=54005 RepID=UPI002903A4B6|nr:hypothetical protein [Peptoniphilus harei]MDU2373636.1 hypothetical protein [Peptoniphilus harei]
MVALGNVANAANLKAFQVENQEKHTVSSDLEANRNILLGDLFAATGIESEKLGDFVGQTVKVTAYLEKGDVKATDVYTVKIVEGQAK